MTEITLNFDKSYQGEIPSSEMRGGIYLVYAKGGSAEKPTWTFLDVGQGANIYNRHLNHERKSEWISYAKKHNESLAFFTAEVTNEHGYRDIAEAALLYKWQPKIPVDGKSDFHHDDAKIVLKGYFDATITARRTAK